jgi:hypothetical protein
LRFTGDPGTARAVKLEQAEIAREQPGASIYGWQLRWLLAATLADLSGIDLYEGRVGEAEAEASEALALRLALEDPVGIAHAEHALATVRYARGDDAGSLELFQSAAGRLRGAHRNRDLADAELGAAWAEIGLGRLSSAAGRLRTVSPDLEVIDRRGLLVNVADVAALLAARGGDAERAARLFGAVDRLIREGGLTVPDLPRDQAARQSVRAALGSNFDSALHVGQSLTDSAVIDLVAAVTADVRDAER